MKILSSFSQEGKRLSFICTLQHKKEESEGVIVFLCKDKSGDCSPENSLEQLRLKKDPGTDGVNETSSQLVFTIDQATPSDSGTYQCCASSKKPDVRLQGHFFSVLVTGELLMSLNTTRWDIRRVDIWKQVVVFTQPFSITPTGKCFPQSRDTKVTSFCPSFKKI